MRLINLAPYKTGDKVIVASADDKKVIEDEEFDIRKSLVACLFADDRIDPRELIKRDKLASMIEQWEGDRLLLEDADWDCIQRGLIVIATNDRKAVEFSHRVLEAPTVEVSSLKVEAENGSG